MAGAMQFLSVAIPIGIAIAGALAYIAYHNPVTYRTQVAPVVRSATAVTGWIALGWIGGVSVMYIRGLEAIPSTVPVRLLTDQSGPLLMYGYMAMGLSFVAGLYAWLLTNFHKDLP